MSPARSRQLFADGPSAEDLQLLDRIRQRTAADRQALLERLMEAGKPINLSVTPVPDSAYAHRRHRPAGRGKKTGMGGREKRRCLAASSDRSPRAFGDALAGCRSPCMSATRSPRRRPRVATRLNANASAPRIIASFIGVTSADFCMADTATLVMRNRPGQPRSVALVPSIHIAVITLDQILADMKELFALLRWDERYRPEGLSNYMSFISGPSKTADIEATMVHGAHGPREVHLFVITG